MKDRELPGITWNKARLAQYMERTGLNHNQAVSKFQQLYGSDCNQERVNEHIDPIVDEQYQSQNKPPMHG